MASVRITGGIGYVVEYVRDGCMPHGLVYRLFFMNLVMSLKNIAGREDKSVKWLRSRREERTGRNGSGTLLWLCEKRNDKSV